MRKKILKKSTLSKVAKLFAPKPSTTKEEMSKAERNFVKAMFEDPHDYGKVGSQLGSSSYPTLENGIVDIDVLSTIDSRRLMGKIYQKHHTDKITLTLTPISDYQIKNQWPEPPFVNVNLFNSEKTSKDNWVGYIEMGGPDDVPLDEMVSKHGNVNVWASVHQKQGEYCTTLHLSNKYKYDEKKTVSSYISHNNIQIKYLTKLACDTGRDYIPVDILKDSDGKNYNFVYNKTVVGSASIKKIDGCLNGKELHRAFVRIAKFRFDDDNKHYSSIILQIK